MQSFQTLIIFGGLGLVVVVSLFFYRLFQRIKLQKYLLAEAERERKVALALRGLDKYKTAVAIREQNNRETYLRFAHGECIQLARDHMKTRYRVEVEKRPIGEYILYNDPKLGWELSTSDGGLIVVVD